MSEATNDDIRHQTTTKVEPTSKQPVTTSASARQQIRRNTNIAMFVTVGALVGVGAVAVWNATNDVFSRLLSWL